MKNSDSLALALTLIGALMRRIGVEQADITEQELNAVRGTVEVESIPGSRYVRIDLRPEAEEVD